MLDITHDLIEIVVRLDGKRLVAPLVNVARTDATAILLPVANVGDGELLHERGQIAFLLRPQHKMPVIGHQAIRTDPHRATQQRFGDDLLEGLVVSVVVEQAHAADATVQYVEDHSTWRDSRGSGHARRLDEFARFVNI